jgi:transcriptional regulator with XRE-family HTH domain
MTTNSFAMEIGTRIRKIREIKGLSQENIASELDMSVTGYGKIERNEVSVNIEKLSKIGKVLGLSVEDIIGFDENIAFNNFNSTIDKQIGRYLMPEEMKELYEENIRLLKEKIAYLEEKIKDLELKK